MTEDPITVTVCISTRNRPEGLARLLTSLTKQVDAPPFEVVVVDNGDKFDAAGIVDSFRSSLNLSYDKEPRVGVVYVRNRSVAMARGDILAFIDDDEDAAPTWLATMHRVLCDHDAVGVIGPVHIRFDKDVSAVVSRCRLFAAVENPEGCVLPWYQTRTSNAYLKKSALPDRREPFKIQFNETGGEDIDLFKSIIDSGGKIVAASVGAEVYEYRGVERANIPWVLKRCLRNGGHSADVEWSGMSLCTRWKNAWACGMQGLKQVIQAYKIRHQDQDAYLLLCIEASENFGRFLRPTGYLYPEYRKRS